MSSTRTRFAPSPTGFLHVGNVRAALFPWLVAKHLDGQVILRVEDTDQAREIEGAVQAMKETLNWLGITWDEGPDVGGNFGPYTQSERKEAGMYLPWAQKLIEKGLAYADIRTPEELDALREDAKSRKRPFLAREYRPENPPTWQSGIPLRFKCTPKSHSWHDEIMGDLSAGEDVVDDFILLKSDGFPTYNFAHIVDDYEMQITHVIRGLEYISSVPKYLSLYEALDITPPVLAHAPHIMAPDGKKKLSKRDGAKSVLDYKAIGYTPEAMLNFLASMGWNDGTEQEIFTKDELIEKFSLERVQRSGARFDEQRLVWMNGHWIRSFSIDELYDRVEDFWPEEAQKADETYKKQVLQLVQERLKFFAELPELTRFFFAEPAVGTELFMASKQTKKVSHEDRNHYLQAIYEQLEDSTFTEEDLEQRLRNLVETLDVKPGALFGIARAAITGSLTAPGLFETMHVLGKKVTLRRLKAAVLP